jgi:hypothetical protein
MSVDEFSDYSSDTAADPVPNEALPTPCAELLLRAPDRNLIRVDGQSYAAAKPTRIRLRLNPLSTRPEGPKLFYG